MDKHREIEMSPNIAKLVEDNINYVYYVLKRFDIPVSELEEFARIGKYGLLKAAMTFQEAKGFKFSTYADQCIQNEIGMEFRRRKAARKYVMFLEEVSKRKREDLMMDSTSYYEKIFIDREVIGGTISAIVNEFPYRKKIIMLLTMASRTQEEISQLFHVDQSRISRLIKQYRASFRDDIERCYTKRKKENWLFHVIMEEAMIKIKFPKEKVSDLKQILNDVLYQVGDSIDIRDLVITFSKTQIIIQMQAGVECLAFIAFLVKAIEDCQDTVALKS